MRRLLLAAVSTLALAACSDPKPAEPAAPTPEAAAAEPALPTETVNIPAQDVATKLAGKWQSTEDPNSTITITAEGDWINDYAGDDSAHDVAKWRAFPGTEVPPNAEGLTFTPASTYIEVHSGENFFFYELGTIQADAFDFFYMSRGNNLSYKRIA